MPINDPEKRKQYNHAQYLKRKAEREGHEHTNQDVFDQLRDDIKEREANEYPELRPFGSDYFGKPKIFESFGEDKGKHGTLVQYCPYCHGVLDTRGFCRNGCTPENS